MILKTWWLKCTVVFSIFLVSACSSVEHLVDSEKTVNSTASQNKPYLILVSLDGFRWDYVKKYQPPYLSEFIKTGVQAESLISCFPSKTFPNHYSIVTGLYPEHHGIINNEFFSYKNGKDYKISNRTVVGDGHFYGGTPIWVLADQSNMVSASYFFVGSEADIQGVRPTYYYTYDSKVRNEDRIAQGLEWLILPEQKRPHIITLYFSDMDDIGHKYSPDNEEEIKKALFKLDNQLGALFKGIEAMDLPVNIMVVSDHGMASVPVSNLIPVNPFYNDSEYHLYSTGSLLSIHPRSKGDINWIIQSLSEKGNHFKVYKTEDTPGFEYIPKNPDWGSVQVIPEFGYYFSSTQRINANINNGISVVGVHGYNPEIKDMHGIFYAKGAAFKSGYTMASVNNIHIYPLMCEILQLEAPQDIDGQLSQMKQLLKNEGE